MIFNKTDVCNSVLQFSHKMNVENVENSVELLFFLINKAFNLWKTYSYAYRIFNSFPSIIFIFSVFFCEVYTKIYMSTDVLNNAGKFVLFTLLYL